MSVGLLRLRRSTHLVRRWWPVEPGGPVRLTMACRMPREVNPKDIVFGPTSEVTCLVCISTALFRQVEGDGDLRWVLVAP